MKLGVFNPVFGDKDLEETLKYCAEIGIEAMEMGCGGFPGKLQLDPKEYINKPEKQKELLQLFEKYNITIDALSTHGNPVSPDIKFAQQSHNDFVDACLLAGQLGIKTVVTFSGCPGGSPNDTTPNWITCPWPNEFKDMLEYQWNDVLVPYWKEAIKIAEENKVNIALEMHPGFCVYNPSTMKKLRNMVGSDNLGVNFDPSHLIWQQIDPVIAISELEGMIYHFHAKDTNLKKNNIEKNGVLDLAEYSDLKNRSWYFQSIGYGTNELLWKKMISELRIYGYDGIISIEHEDAIMSIEEGLEKSAKFLNEILLRDKLPEIWWT